MKRITILLLSLLLLFSMSITAFAGETTISTAVPDSHTIVVNADGAEVLLDGVPGTLFTVERLSCPTLLIRSESGKDITRILLNGEDITNQVKGGYYTMEPIYEDKTLTVMTKAAGTVQGKTYTVQGTVSRNGQPVQNITLELRSTLKTDVTDKDGKFSFDNVECGSHSLTAVENGKTVGYVEFVLTESDNVNLSVSNDTYTVAADRDEIGINLMLNLGDGGTMSIENVTAVQDDQNSNNENQESTESSVTPTSAANSVYPAYSAGSTSTSGTSYTSGPPTGDHTNVMSWIVLMFLSVVGMMAVMGYHKRNCKK